MWTCTTESTSNLHNTPQIRNFPPKSKHLVNLSIYHLSIYLPSNFYQEDITTKIYFVCVQYVIHSFIRIHSLCEYSIDILRILNEPKKWIQEF